MIREALKTLLLINGTIAVGFAVFYQLVMLCLAVDVSAWWAALLFVGAFVYWWRRQCRGAPV